MKDATEKRKSLRRKFLKNNKTRGENRIRTALCWLIDMGEAFQGICSCFDGWQRYGRWTYYNRLSRRRVGWWAERGKMSPRSLKLSGPFRTVQTDLLPISSFSFICLFRGPRKWEEIAVGILLRLCRTKWLSFLFYGVVFTDMHTPPLGREIILKEKLKNVAPFFLVCSFRAVCRKPFSWNVKICFNLPVRDMTQSNWEKKTTSLPFSWSTISSFPGSMIETHRPVRLIRIITL